LQNVSHSHGLDTSDGFITSGDSLVLGSKPVLICLWNIVAVL